jgi:hypothetical protein
VADISANGKQYASEEQLAYAAVLDWGMKLGFVVLVVTFVLYLVGFAAPQVSHEQLAQLWSKPVGEYLKATHTHTGWTWVAMIGKGDYMNFVGIVLLSGVTVLCYLRILPIFIVARDRVFTAIAVLEVLVLVLAASGILATGH